MRAPQLRRTGIERRNPSPSSQGTVRRGDSRLASSSFLALASGLGAALRWGGVPAFGLMGSLFLLGLAGCDNPACVFSTQGCNTNGSGETEVGTALAFRPSDGQQILGTAPTLEQILPSGDGVQLTSPVVLRFSESMNPVSLAGAFLLGDRFSGELFPLQEPPVLVGDGRIVVLQPRNPLPDGREFELRMLPGALVTDITGQEWVPTSPNQLVSFGTDANQNPNPRVLLTEPAAGDMGVSDLTEISVVFDRKMDPGTFDSTSMAIAIGGTAPTPNPQPTSGFSGATAVESVWTWSSEDAFGARVSLGPGASGRLVLSPSGNRLADPSGNNLDTLNVDFTLAAVGAPVAGFKPFGAQDAIGLGDLNNPAIPVLQVELEDLSEPGDELYLYVFGESPENNLEIAFLRRIPIAMGIGLVDLFPADVQLLDGAGAALLKDGTIRVACEVVRGAQHTGLRRLDGNPLVEGVQDYGLDTLAPGIYSMGFNPEPSGFLRSDQRDLVAFGLASEALTGARVSTSLGNNVGTLDPPAPTQVGALNLFVAAPVPLGLIDPGSGLINFDVQAFDQALNTPSMPFPGQYQQVGVASTGTPLAGGTLQVWVHHSESLEPIAGARVLTHQDDGSVTFLGSALTDSSGTATVPSAAAGITLVTVDMPGFDLFTFCGAPRDRMQVLLNPIVPPASQWTGQVQALFPVAPLVNVDVFVSDTRLSSAGSLWRSAGPCTLDTAASLYRCNFGPELGRTNRIGFGTFVAADRTLPQQAFSPLSFLRAFGWETGQSQLTAEGLPTPSVLFVDTLLTTGVIEDLPIEIPAQVLSIAAAPGLGTLLEAPRVMVDSRSPGMGRPVLVGMGIAYDAGANQFDIRSAIPGVVDGVQDSSGDALGVLVEFGTIETDHFLRVEVEDQDGNMSVVRRHLSELDGSLVATDVPVLLDPTPGSSVAGAAYTIHCSDPLRDGLGMGGVYQVRLTAVNGRSWSLWRQDPADAATDLQVQVPDIASHGGTPLPAGTTLCRISYWAAPGLDDSEFLWSDLARDAERYGRSELFTYTRN
ncbi:MAG: hypothetical protein H6830_11560 [Planctomycetes bacterium]|nr:hypothetical protein [Planctomycetota bacterium]MCB9908695.1 hypothetical protein [Planctomycetota bacterium]MCB9913164.1 hypothetical protein [Planctomycetota bacterium]